MKKALYIILLMLPMLVSCTKKGIIPKDTLADIYCEIYICDQIITNNDLFDRQTDTLLVYEPIFNKYGFTSADYLRTTDYYLTKPDKFAKIFKSAQEKLKKRKAVLEQMIAAESGKGIHWEILDSLEFTGSPEREGNSFYRSLRLLYFVPDTLPVTAPAIDSIILNNPENYFFLYDSLVTFDGKITLRVPVKETVKVKDTVKVNKKDIIQKDVPGPKEKFKAIKEGNKRVRRHTTVKNEKKDTIR